MKTLEKLEDICKPHGVEFDSYKDDWGDWHITFYAPPEMCWGSSTATACCYNGGPLSGVIGYLKRELESGFYEADDEALRITGQGKYAGA